jgi:hypothetical protein
MDLSEDFICHTPKLAVSSIRRHSEVPWTAPTLQSICEDSSVKNTPSPRLRNTRQLRSLPIYLDALESRLLLSSTHADAPLALTPAALNAVTVNSPPTALKVTLKNNIIKGTFKDADKNDTHTVSIDWGDGTSSTIPLGVANSKFQINEHTYALPGAYSAAFTVTDQSGAHTSVTLPINFNNFDLAPSLTKALAISNSVFTGVATSDTINVTVTNLGFAVSPTGSVSIFLRPTGGGSDINITTSPATLKPLKATLSKNGTTKHASDSVDVDVTIPLTLATGTYSLVFKVSDGETSTFANNNTLVDNAFTLTATPGSISITPSLSLTKIPATITAGTAANGNISFTLTNNGNIPTPGKLEYTGSLVLHPTSGSDIPLIPPTDITFDAINPDGDTSISSHALALTTTQTSLIPPGTYTLIGTLVPTNGTPGTTFTVTGPTITFTASSNTGTTTLLKHGDTVNFTGNTQLNGQNFLERGFFTTNVKHISGTYEFTPSGLVLTYSNGDIDTLAVTLTGTQTFFDPDITNGDPTTVIFSTDPTGSFASILAPGSSTPFFAKDA